MKLAILFLIMIDFILSKESVLYNSSFTIKFSEVIELKLNLTELTIDYKEAISPFLKITVLSELNDNCLKNKNVSYFNH